jgi:hypothetical protein
MMRDRSNGVNGCLVVYVFLACVDSSGGGVALGRDERVF